MTPATNIPFLDLITPHQELKAELLAVVEKVLNTGCFIGGSMVEEFEREFAHFCNAKYCVGVNSGTDALRFAFMAAGIEPLDIVVTVPHTFIATTEAISQVGAQIAFVDIDETTYTMDPQKLREYIDTRCEFDPALGKLIETASKRPVTAVVPVHLYGQTADMDPILDALQAGFLSVKLHHLANGNESRRELAHRYHKMFADVKDSVIVPREATWTKGVYHLYVVRVQDRQALQASLGEAGIGTGIHYPIPLHLQKAYEGLGYKKGSFPVTERVAAEIVSLPMFPQLKHSQQEEVVSRVKEFYTSKVSATH
jgi:dTDP-4-amino-4,6-dideoxygalactose transaminase